LLQKVIIPTSVEVIDIPNVGKANIETLRHESGPNLPRLQSECFAGCLLWMIQLRIELEALPCSCFVEAKLVELTFENEPDIVQFSFRQFRIVYFTIVHMEMEVSQSRFSCSSKGAGFDPFQNSVVETVRIYILAFW
jgi:hypothetical protein